MILKHWKFFFFLSTVLTKTLFLLFQDAWCRSQPDIRNISTTAGNLLETQEGSYLRVRHWILCYFEREMNFLVLILVLRIHDILVWIRIRIRGSMHLNNGSGSSYFRHWPSIGQQKTNKKKVFLLFTFRRVHLHHFSKISQKEVTNSRNQGFSYYFCLMIEGTGSMTLTNGSGSRRPKNIRIRRIRIRIRNTG